MGRMTGWRGDMVIFDDLLEINAVSSEAVRSKLQAWIDTEVLPAINPGPREKVLVIGTRKHIDDWYGQLLINPDYKHRVDKAFLDEEENTTLWPHVLDEQGSIIGQMFTREKLLKRKREIGTLRFNQEYMNEPSPPEGLEFKMDWLRYYDHLPEWHMDYYIGIDPSSGKHGKRIKSYFAMVCVAHDTQFNKIYVVDMYRGQDSKRTQVDKAVEWASKYKPEMIFVETVFEYTHVYDALLSYGGLNVAQHDYIHTPIKGTQAVKKETRITEVAGPAFEMGRLIIPRPEHHPYVKAFLEHEYRPFPLGEMDLLDALVLAIHDLSSVTRISDVPFYFP
jgi:hypothetical protein